MKSNVQLAQARHEAWDRGQRALQHVGLRLVRFWQGDEVLVAYARPRHDKFHRGDV